MPRKVAEEKKCSSTHPSLGTKTELWRQTSSVKPPAASDGQAHSFPRSSTSLLRMALTLLWSYLLFASFGWFWFSSQRRFVSLKGWRSTDADSLESAAARRQDKEWQPGPPTLAAAEHWISSGTSHNYFSLVASQERVTNELTMHRDEVLLPLWHLTQPPRAIFLPWEYSRLW